MHGTRTSEPWKRNSETIRVACVCGSVRGPDRVDYSRRVCARLRSARQSPEGTQWPGENVLLSPRAESEQQKFSPIAIGVHLRVCYVLATRLRAVTASSTVAVQTPLYIYKRLCVQPCVSTRVSMEELRARAGARAHASSRRNPLAVLG